MSTNQRHRGFLTVDYKEGDTSTFNGITLKYGDKVKKFNTGDPVVDFFDYNKFIHTGMADQEGIAYIIESSSITTFFRESEEIELRSMTHIIDKFILLSEEVEGDNIYPVVIVKGMKTIDELIDYVKTKR